MKVDTLQQLLRSLAPTLTALGASQKVASDLEKTCQGLEPFKDYDFGRLADFLAGLREEFERTGVVRIPAAPRARRAAAAKEADRAKVEQVTQRVRELQGRAAAPDASVEALLAELDGLQINKLGKPEALEVARELGVAPAPASLSEARKAIRAQVAEAYERTGRGPFRAVRAKADAPVDEAKVRQIAQRVRELEERATNPDVPLDDLIAEVDGLKIGDLPKAEAVQVARELGIVTTARTTREEVAKKVRRTVLDRRQTPERAGV
jgi:hypothetical protein